VSSSRTVCTSAIFIQPSMSAYHLPPQGPRATHNGPLLAADTLLSKYSPSLVNSCASTTSFIRMAYCAASPAVMPS
jgi:hypothetical protein